jgi:hypothetical protein
MQSSFLSLKEPFSLKSLHEAARFGSFLVLFGSAPLPLSSSFLGRLSFRERMGALFFSVLEPFSDASDDAKYLMHSFQLRNFSPVKMERRFG